jgi:hypothetical protein
MKRRFYNGHYCPDRKAAIIRARQQGATFDEIAFAFGISRSAVAGVIWRNNNG